MDFKNESELREWLEEKGISTLGWGTGPYKTVKDLLNEIKDGESQLNDEPMRVVRYVSLLIRKENKCLIEKEQVFPDGRVRQRDRMPCEKLKGNEDIISGAGRCLQEELLLKKEQYNIGEIVTEQEEQKDSKSYPGLKAQYIRYIVKVKSAFLPEDSFETEEGVDYTVSRHKWEWVTLNGSNFLKDL